MAGSAMGQRRVSPATVSALVGAGLVVVLGLMRILQPVSGDQALSIDIGRRLVDGAVMYRDVWDIRQPVTYYFAGVAGWLFGTNGVGLRIGEIIWQGATAFLIARHVTQHTGSRRAGVITAVAAIGPIFWMMKGSDVAQPETLAILPLYLAFWLATDTGSSRRVAGIGVLTVFVAMIKILIAPLPALFLLVALWNRRRVAPDRVSWGRTLAIYVAAVAAALALVVIWLGATGSLGDALHTWFVEGPAMRSLSPPPLSRLASSLGRIALFTSPVLVAAIVRVVQLARDRAWPPLREQLAVVWLVGSLVAILPQQWWDYLFLAVVPPLGLLAGPVLVRWLSQRVRLAAAVVVIAALFVVADRGYPKAVAQQGIDADAIAARLDGAYVDRDALRSVLHADGAAQGSIFVFGNPVLLLDVGRHTVVATHGWSPEFQDAERWDTLAVELRAAAPAYIVVDDFSLGYITDRGPEILTWLGTDYTEVAGLPSGDHLYRHR